MNQELKSLFDEILVSVFLWDVKCETQKVIRMAEPEYANELMEYLSEHGYKARVVCEISSYCLVEIERKKD